MNTSTPNLQQRQYIGFLLNVNFYADILRNRIGEHLVYVNLPETIRQMLHMYFYAENLPSPLPADTYLGATAVYNQPQANIPNHVRAHILTVLSDTQWDLHDYINNAIQYALGINVAREREYYYRVDGGGHLMVYVPLNEGMKCESTPLPESAVVYACFSTLPMDKRMAFGPAMVNMTTNPGQRVSIAGGMY